MAPGSQEAIRVTIVGPDPLTGSSFDGRTDGSGFAADPDDPLHVMVVCDGPVAVVGRTVRTIPVQREGEWLSLEFVVVASEWWEGSALVRLMVHQGGVPVSTLPAIRVDVDRRAQPLDWRRTVTERLSSVPGLAGTATLLITPAPSDGTGGGRTLSVALTDGAGLDVGGETRLVEGWDTWLAKLGALYERTTERRPMERLLRPCHHIARALPQEIRDALNDPCWLHRTINLVTPRELDSIPWELALLAGDARSPSDDLRFLGQSGFFRCEISGPVVAADKRIKVKEAYWVLPDYQKTRKLPKGEEEADRLKRLGFRHLHDADLRRMLSGGRFQALHYIGHGDDDATGQYLELIDGGVDNLIDCDELRTMQLHDRPLIVLNSCNGGSLRPRLVEHVGFRASFLEAGAAAFVGSQRRVHDSLAAGFAKVFYQVLLERGLPLAEAVRATRTQGDLRLRMAALSYVAAGTNPGVAFELT
jgi:hypothetical protein